MRFDGKYFHEFGFTKEQIERNFENALKDLRIAEKVEILEVKFTYAYSAFIKAGIALISFYGRKVRSVPGHHIKIIEKMAEALTDDTINDIGNVMRSKRNLDFYSGGIEVTKKETEEYIKFVDRTLICRSYVKED